MKTTFIVPIAVFFLLLGSELPTRAEWAKTFDGSQHDDAYAVRPTADGGFVVAGYTEPLYAGNKDFWILKLDAEGEPVWQKSYGGACPCEYAWSVEQTADEGYIVAGYTCSCEWDFDFWVLKLDFSGNIIWQKAYGGRGAEHARTVKEVLDADGNPEGYIIGGETRSFGMGERDLLILKLSLDGSIVWQKTFGGEGSELLTGIEQTEDGGFIVSAGSGSFSSSSDSWILKLNPDGTAAWQVAYVGPATESAQAVRQTFDVLGNPDGYIVAGNYRTSDPENNGDVMVMKLNPNGSVAWQRVYGGVWADGAEAVTQTFDQQGDPDGYMVAGYLASFGGGTPANIWLLKLNLDGSLDWHSHYGGTDGDRYEHGRSVFQAQDGGFVAAGYTQLHSTTKRDVVVLKTDAEGDIPYCNLMAADSEITVLTTAPQAMLTNLAPLDQDVPSRQTSAQASDTGAETSVACSGELTFYPFPNPRVIRLFPLLRPGTAVILSADGSVSSGPGSIITSYQWDMDGDGLYDDDTGQVITYSWQAPGTYTVGLKVTESGGRSAIKRFTVAVSGVVFDVKPGSCLNPISASSRGVLPAALLGSEFLDVRQVDPASLTLLGVPPLRWSVEDVASPVEPDAGYEEKYGCTTTGPDGIDDLGLKFETRQVLRTVESLLHRQLQDGEALTLNITGHLYDGTSIHGEDVVILRKKGAPGKSKGRGAVQNEGAPGKRRQGKGTK